jgi:hypothetical protein
MLYGFAAGGPAKMIAYLSRAFVLLVTLSLPAAAREPKTPEEYVARVGGAAIIVPAGELKG